MKDEIKSAQDFLLRSQLPGTGWGYSNNSPEAYPEPTCYSLLALADTSFSPTDSLTWLSSLVSSDGKLYLPNDNMPNWATSPLIITLIRLNQLPEVRTSSVNWLLEWKSLTGDSTGVALLDGSLVGWSWISDTFSWVEPTSYAVLALKFAGLKTHARVKEGEAVVFDRMCVRGGWNFGNPVVFGKELDPSAVDTALALFALQDLPDPDNKIDMSLNVLEQRTIRFPSALSLALTILCLNIYNRPIDQFVDLLLTRQESDGSWKQMNWWTALAALALQAVDGGENVFRL